MDRPPPLKLQEILRENGGSATYEQLMERALYDSESGYYSRHIRDIGQRGDFTTTSGFHPVLGCALAAWILASVRGLGWSPPWHVIEIGGGNGTLAGQILRALPFFRGLLTRYHIVETSPVLRKLQQKRLGFRAVRWHQEMQRALRAARGRALLLSNELIDAFPAVVLQKSAGEWLECGLSLRENAIQPCWKAVDPARFPSAAFTALRWAEAGEGQRCELHASCREWMRDWAPFWREGRMLTVDYGDAFPDLYCRRPAGSLRAYFAHQMLEGADVFARPGRQDITVDVNFSDLMAWGGELGWESASFQTQAEFLAAWAPDKCVSDSKRPEIEFLLAPEGAGGAFKVLEQRKEVQS